MIGRGRRGGGDETRGLQSPTKCLAVTRPCGTSLEIEIVRSRRARRLTLRVDPRVGTPKLTLPLRVPVAEARDFVERNLGWLEKALARAPQGRPYLPGAEIPFFGRDLVIAHEPGRGRPVEFDEDGACILVRGQIDHVERRVEDWLKREAAAEAEHLAVPFAKALGRAPVRITMRDTRSRWGSCSSSGTISLSWRLVHAPYPVFEYVVAHEIAHLKHFDHSRAFWTTVDQLTPHRKVGRDWLAANGGRLFAYGRSSD